MGHKIYKLVIHQNVKRGFCKAGRLMLVVVEPLNHPSSVEFGYGGDLDFINWIAFSGHSVHSCSQS
uniref:Uncharacterized protein n=1 Tax=Solanum tuberosum TaxID=4113 RepID=M1D0E3_SOLTU